MIIIIIVIIIIIIIITDIRKIFTKAIKVIYLEINNENAIQHNF